MLTTCYLCLSSKGAVRDHGGVRIALCDGCNRYVVKLANRVQA